MAAFAAVLSAFLENMVKKIPQSAATECEMEDSKKKFTENDLVILKEENTHPGRIENLHFGQDGKSRVVTVKTQNGTYVRPISKLVLILEEDE